MQNTQWVSRVLRELRDECTRLLRESYTRATNTERLSLYFPILKGPVCIFDVPATFVSVCFWWTAIWKVGGKLMETTFSRISFIFSIHVCKREEEVGQCLLTSGWFRMKSCLLKEKKESLPFFFIWLLSVEENLFKLPWQYSCWSRILFEIFFGPSFY